MASDSSSFSYSYTLVVPWLLSTYPVSHAGLPLFRFYIPLVVAIFPFFAYRKDIVILDRCSQTLCSFVKVVLLHPMAGYHLSPISQRSRNSLGILFCIWYMSGLSRCGRGSEVRSIHEFAGSCSCSRPLSYHSLSPGRDVTFLHPSRP